MTQTTDLEQRLRALASREDCMGVPLPIMAELARLRAENEALREALEPFAKAADIRLCGDWRDDQHFGRTDVQFYLTFGDLRRARAALKGSIHE